MDRDMYTSSFERGEPVNMKKSKKIENFPTYQRMDGSATDICAKKSFGKPYKQGQG